MREDAEGHERVQEYMEDGMQMLEEDAAAGRKEGKERIVRAKEEEEEVR